MRLVGRSKSNEPRVALDIEGTLDVLGSGRMRAVDLQGAMVLTGEDPTKPTTCSRSSTT